VHSRQLPVTAAEANVSSRSPFEHDGALSAVSRHGCGPKKLSSGFLVLAASAKQINDDGSERAMVLRRWLVPEGSATARPSAGPYHPHGQAVRGICIGLAYVWMFNRRTHTSPQPDAHSISVAMGQNI